MEKVRNVAWMHATLQGDYFLSFHTQPRVKAVTFAHNGLGEPTAEFLRAKLTEDKATVKEGLGIYYRGPEFLPTAGKVIAEMSHVHAVALKIWGLYIGRDINTPLMGFLRDVLSSKYLKEFHLSSIPIRRENAPALLSALISSRINSFYACSIDSLGFWVALVEVGKWHPTLLHVHTGGFGGNTMLAALEDQAILNMQQPVDYEQPWDHHQHYLRYRNDIHSCRARWSGLITPLTPDWKMICHMDRPRLVFQDHLIECALERANYAHRNARDDGCMLFTFKNCRFHDGMLPDMSAFRKLRRLRIIGCGWILGDEKKTLE